jgi:hypothetical protein
MRVTKAQSQQIMGAFGLTEFQRVPFGTEQKYKRNSPEIGGSHLSAPLPVWKTEFQQESGTKYICGIATEHIRAIANKCSHSGGYYGLRVQTLNTVSPLAQGHLINLAGNKEHLEKIYESIEEFICDNPSPVEQNLFLNHRIIYGRDLFIADIIYRAIYKIIDSLSFEDYVRRQEKYRHLKNIAPIKSINNLFAQDTYVKLIL